MNETNVILIGAGIMSATLGTLLKQLNPDIKIQIFERLDSAAAESSDAWNNAGTGHSAFCELNYTPQKPDGSINSLFIYLKNCAFELILFTSSCVKYCGYFLKASCSSL